MRAENQNPLNQARGEIATILFRYINFSQTLYTLKNFIYRQLYAQHVRPVGRRAHPCTRPPEPVNWMTPTQDRSLGGFSPPPKGEPCALYGHLRSVPSCPCVASNLQRMRTVEPPYPQGSTLITQWWGWQLVWCPIFTP